MISSDNCVNRCTPVRQTETTVKGAMPNLAALLFLICSLLLVAACMPIAPEEPAPLALEEQPVYPPGVQPMAYLEPEVDEQQTTENASEAQDLANQAVLTVLRPNINIRSGPGTDFQIVANAVEGDSFTTIGKTGDGWWQVCCVEPSGDSESEQSQTTWIYQSVVTPDETAEALPVLQLLFPLDLAALWNVQYECGSRRCAVSQCAATSRTEVQNIRELRWLEINRIVTWEEACGENSTWPHQIDRIEGIERYPNSTGLFFFNYWIGPRPGDANARFDLDSGEEIEVWCSDELEAEVTEESGWTTFYNGLTCHDIRTGMLVSMQYTKRWFFTGEFEGDRYERAYFGDYEIYKVKLETTNAILATVNARAAE